MFVNYFIQQTQVDYVWKTTDGYGHFLFFQIDEIVKGVIAMDVMEGGVNLTRGNITILNVNK